MAWPHSRRNTVKATSSNKATALIDGDIYLFKAAVVTEHAINWEGDLWTLHANLSDAQEIFDEGMRKIKTGLNAGDIIIALSDTTNFRYSVWPQYKSNRKDKRPPILREPLRRYVLENYSTFLRPGLEADDVLGILSTSSKIVKGPKVIVSEDKDLKTIPGVLYNTRSGELSSRTEEEADYQHMIQTLTGDTSDGYPGCPGVGPVKAEKLLSGKAPAEWWAVVVEAYEKAGLNEAVALTQARVARICRNTDYNFNKKEVILWTPIKCPDTSLTKGRKDSI
jgi:DNA polymerase-1